jgi:ABC-2 type transport system permease protein
MSVAAARVKGAATTGTKPLLHASLRFDGRRMMPWVVLATFLSTSSVVAYPLVFPDEQDRLALAAAISANPALGLIFGPARDLTTVDGFNAWRSLALGGFLAGLGAILTVIRATRGQEDSGQAELLASGVIGRSTRLLVGVAMSMIGSLVLGVVAALVTVLFGGDWGSTLLLAATFTATGWMFAAVAAVTAQIGADARTASSMAVGTLGVLFLLRGVCYSLEAPSWTVWVNPLGWTMETRPATGDRWWPLLLAVAFTGAVAAVAFRLQSRRDFGQGAIAPGPGPARGTDRSTWRLALRINRGAFTTWFIAFIVLGVVFGFFTSSVQDILGSDATVQKILAAGATTPDELTSAFVVTILSLVGILTSVPGVQAMLRVRSEELADRVEPIIAAGAGRSRYYASNVGWALLAPTAFVLLAGTLIAALAAAADIGVAFGEVVGQAAATVPAVWTVVAVSVAVVGARPAVSLAAWLGVLASFVLTLLGPTFGLDDWILAISPFWHVPDVAVADPDWSGLGWIMLVAALLVAVGFAGFRRRDLAR